MSATVPDGETLRSRPDAARRGADARMVQDREVVAFCETVRPQLVGTLTLYCGDPHLAEELAQDTLVRVWDRWGRIGGLHNRTGYVHRMALNAANSWFRRRAAEQRARSRLPGAEALVVDDVASRLALRSAVRALPPRQRAALVLRFYADLPVAEVAVLMRCRPGTVKSLTHHAVAALRGQDLIDEEAGDAR